MGVNGAGHAVGWAMNAAGKERPALWLGNTATDIGGTTLPDRGYAIAINDAGSILLDDVSQTGARYLYRNGSVVTIASLLPAGNQFYGITATDLNNGGQMVGYGRHPSDTRLHALLISPVPVDPEFTLTPISLAFTNSSFQEVTLENTGSSPFTFTLSAAVSSSGPNWLSVTSPAPSVVPGQAILLTVAANLSGLTPGTTHTGTVSVVAGRVTHSVDVTLQVPSQDEVTWGPGGPLPMPGTAVAIGQGHPAILAPVGYKLGSQAAAQLSLEAWDQAGNYLGGTDARRVTRAEGSALAFFKIAGFRTEAAPAGITSITIKALLTSDDGITVLASSPSAIYPLVAPLTVTWGEVNQLGEAFAPRAWDRIIVSLDSRDIYPAARLTLPAAATDRTLVGGVLVKSGGTPFGQLSVASVTVAAGFAGPATLALGPAEVRRFPEADEFEFVVLVMQQGRLLNRIVLDVPAVGVRIAHSSVPEMTGIDAGPAPTLTVEYKPGSGPGWDVVVLNNSQQSVRTLLSPVTGAGQFTVNDLRVSTELFTAVGPPPFFDPKVLRAGIGLRQNGVVVAFDEIYFLDDRVPPTEQILAPGSDLDRVITALVSLKNVTSTTNLMLTPRTESISPAALASAETPAAAPGSPAGGTGIARKWGFGTTVPEDGSFAASLVLKYLDADLPDDPGFAESRLQIIAMDPATGTSKALPTVIDPVQKTATAAITGLAANYTLGMVGAAESRFLDFPVWRADSSLTGRLLLVNRSGQAQTVTLTALSEVGGRLGDPALNPGAMRVTPWGAAEVPVEDFYGLAGLGLTGWVQGAAEAPLLGLLRLGSEGRVDFLAPPTATGESVLPLAPHSSTGAGAELQIANPTRFENTVTLTAVTPAGSAAASGFFRLAPRGRLAGRMERLLPALPPDFAGSLRISAPRPVSACALYLRDRAAGGLRAEPVTGSRALAVTLIAPWLAHGGGTHRATLTLVNPGGTTARITVRAVDDGGSTLGTATNLTLGAGQQFSGNVGTMLSLDGGALTVATLKVTSDRSGVCGHVLVAQEGGNPSFLTVLPLETTARSEHVFAAFNEATGFATEVSVFNPTLAAQNFMVSVFRTDGTAAGTAQVTVPAEGRTTRRLRTLVAASANLDAGYFTLESPVALFAAATIFETSGNSLAAVPAQMVGLPPTAAGAGLLAWWDFNDATNPTVSTDLVRGHAGRWLDGGKFTAAGGGRTGAAGDRAADFSLPASDRLEIANAAWLNEAGLRDQITFSFWQKLTTLGAGTSFHAVSPGSEVTRGAHAHSPWSDGSLYWDTGGGNNATTWRVSQAPPAAFDHFVWHHFAFLKNGDSKEIWVDGARIGFGTNTADLAQDMTKLVIGAHDPPTGSSDQLQGLMDDFAVYKAALTREEIQQLASGTAPNRIGTPRPIGFRVQQPTMNAATRTVSLTWGSQAGAAYTVQQSDDLKIWRNVQTGLRAASGTNTAVTVPPASTESLRMYFRIKAQ